MQYVSTRGQSPALNFSETVLSGLAPDGGLYVPEAWPTWSEETIRNWRGLSYAELAVEVLLPFVGDENKALLTRVAEESYGAEFRHPAVAPMVQIGKQEWVLELFHGPTLAFKDFALQCLGRLIEHFLAERGEQLTIVGATSGDTGSAAIAGLRGRKGVDVFIMHPKGRVSDVQRRQMTSVLDANVHNIALEGSFDDCQDMVKALFADEPFRHEMKLGAVNSINWARIAAQMVYYVYAALELGAPEQRVVFSVPTGNFGDIYAGFAAQQAGLPIEKLLIATNRNDILPRFLETGVYKRTEVHPTIAPSMDIQVASNFERLLWEMHGKDGDVILKMMQQFKQSGELAVSEDILAKVREYFAADRASEDEMKAAIDQVQKESGYVVCPHTATSIVVGRKHFADRKVPLVHLATAHPAKFPDAVEAACGVNPTLPPHMADLFEREERMQVLANDMGAVKEFIRAAV